MKIITSTINIFKEQKKTSTIENSFKEERKTALRIKTKTTLEKNEVYENIYQEPISKEDNTNR